jgi:phenylpropionate dioxygenase-like ring-hydroxylating dioxygenase large terminal subunit
MSISRNAFLYQPFSESYRGGLETRLIRLHPDGFNDCVYCTIYHANILERRPQTEYTALSCVWGDAIQTQAIQLGYHQLPTSEAARTWPSAYRVFVSDLKWQQRKQLFDGKGTMRGYSLYGDDVLFRITLLAC